MALGCVSFGTKVNQKLNGVLQRDFVLSPSTAYIVDFMHEQSAEAVAAFV